jgi:hypothetical protein
MICSDQSLEISTFHIALGYVYVAFFAYCTWFCICSLILCFQRIILITYAFFSIVVVVALNFRWTWYRIKIFYF